MASSAIECLSEAIHQRCLWLENIEPDQRRQFPVADLFSPDGAILFPFWSMQAIADKLGRSFLPLSLHTAEPVRVPDLYVSENHARKVLKIIYAAMTAVHVETNAVVSIGFWTPDVYSNTLLTPTENATAVLSELIRLDHHVLDLSPASSGEGGLGWFLLDSPLYISEELAPCELEPTVQSLLDSPDMYLFRLAFFLGRWHAVPFASDRAIHPLFFGALVDELLSYNEEFLSRFDIRSSMSFIMALKVIRDNGSTDRLLHLYYVDALDKVGERDQDKRHWQLNDIRIHSPFRWTPPSNTASFDHPVMISDPNGLGYVPRVLCGISSFWFLVE